MDVRTAAIATLLTLCIQSVVLGDEISRMANGVERSQPLVQQKRELSGIVTDAESGSPIKDAILEIFTKIDPKTMVLSNLFASTRTNDSGFYSFTNFLQEPFYIKVSARSYESVYTASPIEPPAGLRELNFQLSKAIRVEGIVYGESKQPLENVIIKYSKSMRADSPFILYSEAITTDQNGRYVIEKAGAGDLNIYALKQGYTIGYKIIRRKPGDADSRVNIMLMRGRQISGKILDIDGEPIKNASVKFVLDNLDLDLPITVANDEGHFSIVIPVNHEGFLIARAPGFADTELRIEAIDEDEKVVVLKRKPVR